MKAQGLGYDDPPNSNLYFPSPRLADSKEVVRLKNVEIMRIPARHVGRKGHSEKPLSLGKIIQKRLQQISLTPSCNSKVLLCRPAFSGNGKENGFCRINWGLG